METNEQAQSEQAAQSQAGAEQAENNEEIIVNRSAEELAKRLKEVSAEAKQYRQRLAQEKKEKEEIQKKTLAEQGQFKELADIYKAKAETAETQAQKLKEAFAVKTVADAVALEAAKFGCVDTDALIQLLPLDQIPIKDDFSVDRSHVKTILEEFKKNKTYLFQKQAPKVIDATPAKPDTSPDFSKMSLHEKAALLSQLKKQGK